MICCIPTKSRFDTKTYKLFEASGIEVFHFIEPSEYESYDVPNKVNILDNNRGISYVRNFIIDWAKQNNHDWVIMCDDDVSGFGLYNGRSKLQKNADIWHEVGSIAYKYGFDITGINYAQHAWHEKKAYSVNTKNAEVCFMLNMKNITWRYRPEFDLKEDRDFIMLSIKYGKGILKLNHYFFSCPDIGSNKGGLFEKYQERVDQETVKKMMNEWNGFVEMKKTSRGLDLKYDLKGLAKKYQKQYT